MDDVVCPRYRFVLQAGDIVVFDVVPSHIEQIEGIDRYQPVTGALVAELQIESRVRRGLRTVVFHEGRLTEVPCPQAAEPTGVELRRNATVDHRGGAVRDVAAGYGDRLCTRIARGGIAAAQIIRRYVVVESCSRNRAVQIRVQPVVELIGVTPLDARAGRCAAGLGHSRV